MTALHVACEKGHTATAELLIAKGADVEAKNEVGHWQDGEALGWHAQSEKAIVRAKLDRHNQAS